MKVFKIQIAQLKKLKSFTYTTIASALTMTIKKYKKIVTQKYNQKMSEKNNNENKLKK